MSAITVVTDPQAEHETTITMKTDDWYALSNGINMLLAGYADNGQWIPNRRKFDQARNKIAAILLGFNN